MAQHLASLPLCSRQIANEPDSFGDLPLAVLSAATRNPRWLAADEALARTSSRGRHIVSARAGHWLHLDDPSLVAGAIRAIVDQARAGAGGQ
jgi:hypothetical protein